MGTEGSADFTTLNRFSGSVGQHILTTYVQMLKPAAAPLILAALLLILLRERGNGAVRRRRPVMGAHELAALVGFAMVPFLAVPLSILSGHYWLRYSINCTFGLAGCYFILTLYRIRGTSRLSGVAVMAVFGVSFLVG